MTNLLHIIKTNTQPGRTSYDWALRTITNYFKDHPEETADSLAEKITERKKKKATQYGSRMFGALLLFYFSACEILGINDREALAEEWPEYVRIIDRNTHAISTAHPFRESDELEKAGDALQHIIKGLQMAQHTITAGGAK